MNGDNSMKRMQWVSSASSSFLADISFGAGLDLRIMFDGTDAIYDIATTGEHRFTGGNVEVVDDLLHEGTNIGFYNTTGTPQSSAYTVTNESADRSYDANATSLDEIADVLGTLIEDLKLTGIIG